MSPQEALNKLKKAMPKILKEFAEESKTDMLTEIELQFDKPSASEIYRTSSFKSIKPNTGNKLRLITGNLVDSYNPTDENSASSVKITNTSYEAIYKSKLKYASVHERGYKHIPKRPYLKPAEVEYEKDDSKRLKEVLRKIEKIFN